MSRSSVLTVRGWKSAATDSLSRLAAGRRGGRGWVRKSEQGAGAETTAVLQRLYNTGAFHRGAHARPVKTRGDDRDADFVAHVRIDDSAEDQVDIRVSGFLDDGGSLVDLEEGQVGAAGDVEQDAAGAVDGDVEQLAGDGQFGGDAGAVFAGGVANCHQGSAAFGHDRAHIGEVEVDQTGDGDQFGNALDALAQHIIGHAEGILQAGALVDDLQQAVIGDDDQGIGMFFELGDAGFGRLRAAGAFKGEGAGDHADGQGADFLGDLGHDGGSAGAGAAAQAGGDEDHIAAFEHFVQLFGRFFGSFAADLRVAASAQAAGDLVADANAGVALWRAAAPGHRC